MKDIKMFLVISGILLVCGGLSQGQEVDPGEPLYLTPLIKAGEIDQAVEAAEVKEFIPDSTIKSYSGFITVNEEYNSNIFFWFMAAAENSDTAPVILWNDGGPGISSFMSTLTQNGPFFANGSLNPYSWHSKYNIIYMDNPVEVGFSFTDNEGGYIVSGAEAAKDIHQFLVQFFKMFPNLQDNPFYNAGVSFGATYATNAAHYIHLRNQDNPEVKINLTGVIIDSPWVDPISQAAYGDFLFTLGVINEETRDDFKARESMIQQLLEEGKYLEAFQAQIQLTQRDLITQTGFSALNNIYNENYLGNIDVTDFVTQNSTRKALHVGSLNFSFVSSEQQTRMHPHFMESSKEKLDTLLKAGYKFMVYMGNMDGTTGHVGVQKMIKTLTWPGAEDLIKGPRTIWKVDGKVVGYVKSSSNNNATMVIFRNAGHGCIAEQGELVLEAVEKFTNGTPF